MEAVPLELLLVVTDVVLVGAIGLQLEPETPFAVHVVLVEIPLVLL